MSILTPSEHATLQAVYRHFGFPRDYVVADVETSGFSTGHDMILEVGWAVVRDGKVQQAAGRYLDWTRDPRIDSNWLRGRVEHTSGQMTKDNRAWHINWDRLCREGVDPLAGLHEYVTTLFQHVTQGLPVVGHGFWRFDKNMLDTHMQHFMLGYLFPWQPGTIVDTGLIEKAIQTEYLPQTGELLDGWSRRVSARNLKGIKWNLEPHCVTKYGLAVNHGLDMDQAHQAGFDCVVIHHLFETFRRLAEEPRA